MKLPTARIASPRAVLASRPRPSPWALSVRAFARCSCLRRLAFTRPTTGSALSVPIRTSRRQSIDVNVGATAQPVGRVVVVVEDDVVVGGRVVVLVLDDAVVVVVGGRVVDVLVVVVAAAAVVLVVGARLVVVAPMTVVVVTDGDVVLVELVVVVVVVGSVVVVVVHPGIVAWVQPTSGSQRSVVHGF